MRTKIAAALISVAALVPGAAWADTTATQQLNITVQVNPTCSFTLASPVLGTVGLKTTNTVTLTAGTVNLTCSNGTAYAVKISHGNDTTSPNDPAARKLSTGGATPRTITYGLYADATATAKPWGDDDANKVVGTFNAQAPALVAGALPLPIYAKLIGNATLLSNTDYTDTVNVWVEF